ncbi:MAG TPA: chromosome segregation protein SMC [Acidobacteriaceae bacterium]
MLKLKKVQILGFKSFCDRTEVHLSGEGLAAIVGPNGCGKSNISDAITWVLGEQSAKSLRGVHMQDVIFAGTRDRKPTGMAEVSLTLVDPDVYDGGLLPNGQSSSQSGPEIVIENEHPLDGDWDEQALRIQRANETEEAVLEAQPGTIIEGEEPEPALALEIVPPADADAEAVHPDAAANSVVLKIRRRKFNKQPVRAGEIVVTRRIFRSGESEYLLNGKICRLRDIQDIFMGTGLSGENYAIIGQERIGQLLSAKPLDRRAIIEEAAGITRFKTKKRLSELRLESAKQNLSRVNDIFDEVSRQMQTLKRQAAKAERYVALRDELRVKLRVVLASRMSQMDQEESQTTAKINELGIAIDAQASEIELLDTEHTVGTQRGYELDKESREATTQANAAAVELERIASRTASNIDRIAELTARVVAGTEELSSLHTQMETIVAEREQHRSFLDNANAESAAARTQAQTAQAAAQEAGRAVSQAEQQTEQSRHASMQLLSRAAQARSEVTQAEESLASLLRDAERLTRESDTARHELETLGQQRGQVSLAFENVTEKLARLEQEIVDLRAQLETARKEETETKRCGDSLRAEVATLLGRRNSLESLIREHSYSTETVRDIFRANKTAQAAGGHGVSPVGTLADFLEVDGQYESVVDEFLRDELNYIVVKSWDAADEGMRMLSSDVAGRATFLVHPNDAQAKFSFLEGMQSTAGASATSSGVVPLKNCMRVLDGFGRSLEVILPKLREGFVAPNAQIARTLALENPQAFFLSPSGETFHNVTVTGGRIRSEGPLALKRELREIQAKLEELEAELSRTDLQAMALTRHVAELTATLDIKSNERRDAERESANSGAALRAMEAEAAKLERRLQEWILAAERNRETQNAKQELIARKQEESARLEQERLATEATLAALQQRIAELRHAREEAQSAASAASAHAAGIEERRRGAAANFEQTNRIHNAQQQRIAQMEQQIAASTADQHRREEENVQLATEQLAVAQMRESAQLRMKQLSEESVTLRARISELDGKLRILRHENEARREERATLSAHAAKLGADLEHLAATCLNDLGVEAITLREDAEIIRIEAEALLEAEEASRAMKQRLENMGPVNMMALEEFAEAEQRYTFLDTQRKDLIESIENTQQTIKEIDEITHIKFDEAYAVINENFSRTFNKLFGGGQAFMRLTDQENSAESGIELVASPPGKKLQNILLLSGGEKTLTAFSLLVGIFQYQPSPFCVLDEVDAPLDETNVGRFASLVEEMSSTTQFIVITHSKTTMARADIIYGVTMQEPGVSKIVSVKLSNSEKRAVA